MLQSLVIAFPTKLLIISNGTYVLPKLQFCQGRASKCVLLDCVRVTGQTHAIDKQRLYTRGYASETCVLECAQRYRFCNPFIFVDNCKQSVSCTRSSWME